MTCSEGRLPQQKLCLQDLPPAPQMSPEEGGAAGRVAYVDTEGTFRPKRIAEIAKRFQLDPDAVLNNVSSCCLGAGKMQSYALACCSLLHTIS